MDLTESQNCFQELVSKISSQDLPHFFQWIQTKYLVSDCSGEKPAIAYQTLNRISNDIKLMVPNYGLMSSEMITFPAEGQLIKTVV
ncbi:unnamed protein product, partial [Medioppia subpectinata]